MRGEQRERAGERRKEWPQGLTMMAMMRSRLRDRGVSLRKQVGDAESLVNEVGVSRMGEEL